MHIGIFSYFTFAIWFVIMVYICSVSLTRFAVYMVTMYSKFLVMLYYVSFNTVGI